MFKLSTYTSLLFLVMIAVTVACTAGNAAGVAIPGPTVDAAKAANLTISSKLLRAAELVTPSK